MGAIFQKTIPNDMDALADLIEEVDRFLAGSDLPPRAVYAVNLALEEILTNTIKYGYNDDAEHQIQVTIQVDGDQAVLTCVDDGRHFDPLQAPEPDLDSPLEERKVGGVGLHLTTAMMDAIEYTRQDGKNVLVMRVGGKGS